MKSYSSPSHLSEDARCAIAEHINAVLADGIDLHSQLKIAHWNIKGPQFAALHPLFDSYATTAAAFNDEIAERGLVLGTLAVGTARHVAKVSRLPDYPQDVTADMEHVRLLAERFDVYLKGVKVARAVADEHGDEDTVDLLTGVVREWEKQGWFLRATLER